MKAHFVQYFLFGLLTSFSGSTTAAKVTEYIADYGYGYTGHGATAEQACVNLVSDLNSSIDFDGITFETVIPSINDVASPCGDDYLYVIYPACKMGNGEPVDSSGYCTAYASIRTIITEKETYKIELNPLIANPVSDQILARIEPETGDNVVPLVATVVNQNGDIVPDVEIRLEPHVVAYSGGHNHDDPSRHADHTGQLTGQRSDGNAVIGNTSNHSYIFTFTAPAPAGDHVILASCVDIECQQVGANEIWTGFEGLRALRDLVDNEGDSLYELIGMTDTHPDNHYLKPINAYKAVIIATLYNHAEPDAPVLRYNDASLKRGGRFDVNTGGSPWSSPHITHRNGEDLDVRANPEVNPGTAIPSDNFESFRNIAAIVGASAKIHSKGTSNQHFHINF